MVLLLILPPPFPHHPFLRPLPSVFRFSPRPPSVLSRLPHRLPSLSFLPTLPLPPPRPPFFPSPFSPPLNSPRPHLLPPFSPVSASPSSSCSFPPSSSSFPPSTSAFLPSPSPLSPSSIAS